MRLRQEVSAIKASPSPAGRKSSSWGWKDPTCLLPVETGVRVDHWFLGQWHGAHRIASLAQRLLSSILGHSLQGLADTASFGSDPGCLSPQNPINANNPSSSGSFLSLRQLHKAPHPELCSAEKQSVSSPFIDGDRLREGRDVPMGTAQIWGLRDPFERRRMCLILAEITPL